MLRIALIAMAGLVMLSCTAAAQCPPNYAGAIYSPGGTPIVAAAHRDSMCDGPCLWNSSWDHAAGRSSCDAQQSCAIEIPYGGPVGQFTADEFVLTGPGSGPISFVAQMHVTGTAAQGCQTICAPFCQLYCSYGTLRASLKEGSQSSEANSSSGSLLADLQLPLSKNVGQPFRLDMELSAYAHCAWAHLERTLTFALPPGYGMTSCYGYSTPAPTAISRAGWGRLRTLYR